MILRMELSGASPRGGGSGGRRVEARDASVQFLTTTTRRLAARMDSSSQPGGAQATSSQGELPSSMPLNSDPRQLVSDFDRAMGLDDSDNAPPGTGEAEEDARGEGANGRDRTRQRRRGEPRIQRNLEDISRVHDETGEKVQELFEDFLERYGSSKNKTRVSLPALLTMS